MKPLNVHVLYEYGVNFRPHASASLRLLRPLTYPTIRDRVNVTFGFDVDDSHPDLVLVDRLWRPDIRPELVESLAATVHGKGAKLIYWFDDNFMALDGRKSIPTVLKESFQRFLDLSDGYVVSTQSLQDGFSQKEHIIFLPSALDERLIVQKTSIQQSDEKLVIGYMGSATHDEDLKLVLPALQTINERYPGRLQFEVVGALNQEKLANWPELQGLPIRVLQPLPQEHEYPLFMLWFTGATHWDFAIAPLVDNYFNSFKSDIKFLDYTAAGVPGIYSNVLPYASSVEDHKTGLVVENTQDQWETSLVEMIENAALRSNLLRQASVYLYSRRTLIRCADCWVNTLHDMVK